MRYQKYFIRSKAQNQVPVFNYGHWSTSDFLSFLFFFFWFVSSLLLNYSNMTIIGLMTEQNATTRSRCLRTYKGNIPNNKMAVILIYIYTPYLRWSPANMSLKMTKNKKPQTFRRNEYTLSSIKQRDVAWFWHGGKKAESHLRV